MTENEKTMKRWQIKYEPYKDTKCVVVTFIRHYGTSRYELCRIMNKLSDIWLFQAEAVKRWLVFEHNDKNNIPQSPQIITFYDK